jgi:hypothetical protein
LKQSNTYDDQIPVLNDIIPKQLNVTGKATQTGSSFTMDLHLSATNQSLKQSQDTATVIQQQLYKTK